MNNADKPAMPISEETTDRILEGVSIFSGLTKREYFAGLAMQGLCANCVPGPHHIPERLAVEAVEHADALLAALEK